MRRSRQVGATSQFIPIPLAVVGYCAIVPAMRCGQAAIALGAQKGTYDGMTLVVGILALGLLLWLLNSFARSSPQLGSILRIAGGAAALTAAGTMALRGLLVVAIPLAAAGLYLLGWWPRFFGKGPVSRIRTAFMEMEFAHKTGAMRGRILVGRHEGMALDALDVATLVGLLAQIDEESRALLATYLDRRDPAWRDHAQGDAAAGRGTAPAGGPMTEQEAYQVLGLEPGASADEIGRAHRNLMKKLHPDHGGTTYLAARINEAKEALLRRHR